MTIGFPVVSGFLQADDPWLHTLARGRYCNVGQTVAGGGPRIFSPCPYCHAPMREYGGSGICRIIDFRRAPDGSVELIAEEAPAEVRVLACPDCKQNFSELK